MCVLPVLLLSAAFPAISPAAALFIALVVVLALLAVLHPDAGRRSEARRVLKAVLMASRRR